jgi:hypothetical protein
VPRKAKPPLAMATVGVESRWQPPPFALAKDEAEFFATEQITKRMLESDWDSDRDLEEVAKAYKLTKTQSEQCEREATRNMRRNIMRPQSAHQLVASTLARVISESMSQGDLRGAADAAYKLSQATGTQANIKLRVLEAQQRMDSMRTRLLTGQASAEEVADAIVSDLLSGDA